MKNKKKEYRRLHLKRRDTRIMYKTAAWHNDIVYQTRRRSTAEPTIKGGYNKGGNVAYRPLVHKKKSPFGDHRLQTTFFIFDFLDTIGPPPPLPPFLGICIRPRVRYYTYILIIFA